ncbi:hypothetical protein [Actinoplanes sp. URMC 104]|uniref:hypothetical protein n=1 Tax=Actinoplanes sp. URMC 104 TaxID=3423409 RepID=UPI003F19F93D
MVVDLACGCQPEMYACGCRCGDHLHEDCDGTTVAELEETMSEDWTTVTNARELPDGTIVRYDGDDWIAYPEREIGGQKIRWQSENGLAADRAMDRMLDDGAQVVGLDLEAVAEFTAIMKAAGR